ncbi:MAG: hypothetical protein IJV85_04620 [Clostridia bacterium]|nr:hypothetical protein [Clostridia bacterium]
MRYTVQSSKYVLKNFLYLFPFAIIPAFFLSLSTDEKALYKVLRAFFSGELSKIGFNDVFRSVSVLNFGSWQAIVFGFIGIALLVVCVALMMALMEKHLRIGKRTFNGIFSKLNDNLLSTCGYVGLLLLIYEIWSLISAALFLLAAQIKVLALAYVTFAIFFIGMHVALLAIIDHIYLWLPCMQITGFRAFEALHYSQQLMAAVRWKVLLGQMIPLFVCEVLICLCAWLSSGFWVFTILTTALYSILLMIYCVRMELVYFDRDHIERADIARYYH